MIAWLMVRLVNSSPQTRLQALEKNRGINPATEDKIIVIPPYPSVSLIR